MIPLFARSHRFLPVWMSISAVLIAMIDGNVSRSFHDSIEAPEFFNRTNISSAENFIDPDLLTQLAPSVTRVTRSASSGMMTAFLPFAIGTLFDPTATNRQSDPPATQSPLSALLPVLLAGQGSISAPSLGSVASAASAASLGSIGSSEGINSLLPVLAAAAAVTPATAAPLIALPSNLKNSPLNKLSKLTQGTPYAADDPSGKTGCVPTNRSSVCDSLPFDRILSMRNSVIAVKGSSVYRVRGNGEPIDTKPKIYDVKVEPITATAHIKNFHFVFQGDKYTKFDGNLKQAPGKFPRLVSSGFPGVLTPVDGVFQLNNHTYVFISGARFVYFQPDANPNVDPKYSPQYLDNVPGAPDNIDSAFSFKERKFLYKNGTLYELAADEMKVIAEMPAAGGSERSWIKCPDVGSTSCQEPRRNTSRRSSRMPTVTKGTVTSTTFSPSVPLP